MPGDTSVFRSNGSKNNVQNKEEKSFSGADADAEAIRNDYTESRTTEEPSVIISKKRKGKRSMSQRLTDQRRRLPDVNTLLQKDINALLRMDQTYALAKADIELFSKKGIFINSLINKFLDIGRDVRTHDCGHGKKRYVFKNPNKAFYHQFSDWSAKVKSNVDAAGVVKGGADIEIDKKKDRLFQVIEALGHDLERQFKAAYNLYHLNPCNDASYDKWVRLTAQILRFQEITKLMMVQLALVQGDTNAMSKALDNAIKLIQDFINKWLSGT
jgi:hypothetical protein